ncbi:Lrp/AsnC family transcriptional regulator [Haladaptatus sp. NG-SE-30]
MDDITIDDVDRGILHFLQLNARGNTDTFIGEQVGVTATTVSNRIEKLEDSGVIRGYRPDIDYERAGLSLRVLFVCTADPTERADLAEQALEEHGVVTVRQTLAGERNVHIEVVARTTTEIEEVTDELHEIGL